MIQWIPYRYGTFLGYDGTYHYQLTHGYPPRRYNLHRMILTLNGDMKILNSCVLDVPYRRHTRTFLRELMDNPDAYLMEDLL